MSRMDEIRNRTKWWQNDRFGMFIHWGIYSIPACGEWVMSEKEMTVEEYKKYFDLFDPVDYDPRKWVRAAKRAGMKYIVLTAKHHDGFCLFDSAYTDYKSTNTKAKKDLVREFVDACREEDMKVGLYFSIIDWSHPDFPKYGDRQHPMRNKEEYRDEVIDFDRYLDFMHKQVVQVLNRLAPIAEDAGVTVVLEPLNILVDHMGHFLTTSKEAFEMVKEVNNPYVKVLFDIYHQQISEGNIIPNLTKNLDCIAHLHSAGHPGRHETGGTAAYDQYFHHASSPVSSPAVRG